MLLGHTRWATHGEITNKNAHPHQNGTVISTHNGVISNFEKLQQEYETEYEVDSEIISHILSIMTPQSAATKLKGMYTVPFVDERIPHTLQFLRHNNPLHLAFKGREVFYSSQIDHLRWAIDDPSYAYFEVKNDHYLSLTITAKNIQVDSTTISPKLYEPHVYTPPKMPQVLFPRPVYPAVPPYGQNAWDNWNNHERRLVEPPKLSADERLNKLINDPDYDGEENFHLIEEALKVIELTETDDFTDAEWDMLMIRTKLRLEREQGRRDD